MAGPRDPVPGQVQPPRHQGRGPAPQVGREDRRLAVGALAQLAAVLACHSHRLGPVLGDVGPVHRQDPLRLAQRRRHQLPVRRQDGGVVPARLAQEQLLRAHGIGIGSAQAQDHALDRLARLVAEQSLQVGAGVPPQLAATEEGRVARLVGPQPSAHRGNVGAAHGDVGQGYGDSGRGHGRAGTEGIRTPGSYLSMFRCTTRRPGQGDCI